MSESSAKAVISKYLRIDPSQIRNETIIDKSAVNGSIMVHRMYGALATEGIIVRDYLMIRTFAELMSRCSSQESGVLKLENEHTEIYPVSQSGIGIDIEKISNMPICSDFREDQFYKLNFTPQEISYCSIQINPRDSFGGLFAAKEAIVKANASYRKIPFNAIEVHHDLEGKPYIKDLQISISHLGDTAIAVAVAEPTSTQSDQLKNFKDSNDQLKNEVRSLGNNVTWLKKINVFLIFIIVATLVLLYLKS